MTTSTLQLMNSLTTDLENLQVNETQIATFVEMIKGAPVSPTALEILSDTQAKAVVRVRAFARVTTDMQKAS